MINQFFFGMIIISISTSLPFAMVSWMHMGMEEHKGFCKFNAWASCFCSVLAVIFLSCYIYTM